MADAAPPAGASPVVGGTGDVSQSESTAQVVQRPRQRPTSPSTRDGTNNATAGGSTAGALSAGSSGVFASPLAVAPAFSRDGSGTSNASAAPDVIAVPGLAADVSSAAGPSAPAGLPRSHSAATTHEMDTRSDTTASAQWEHVDAAELMQGLPTSRPDIFVKKLHRFFTATAAPVAFVLGVFFVLLLFKAHIEAHTVGRVIAGLCAFLTCAMTAVLITLHLSAFTDPVQQRRIVRILLMAPLYGIESFAALWNYEVAAVIGLARDCYESYVIFTFYNLLMGYLGGEDEALALKRNHHVKCMAPLCCCGTFPLNRGTLRTWKTLLAQYMVLKPLLSLVAIYLLLHGKYDESSWGFDNAHVWFVIVQNVSVTLAFTSLVYFFVEFKEALTPFKPVGKFAAVKAVLFLTFWQSVALGLLVNFGVITGSKEGLWTPGEVSTGINDFLICIEMLLMCYAHRYAFSEKPYVPVTGYHAVDVRSVAFLCSQTDVVLDVVDVVRRRDDRVKSV